jgi:hypothetical protein
LDTMRLFSGISMFSMLKIPPTYLRTSAFHTRGTCVFSRGIRGTRRLIKARRLYLGEGTSASAGHQPSLAGALQSAVHGLEGDPRKVAARAGLDAAPKREWRSGVHLRSGPDSTAGRAGANQARYDEAAPRYSRGFNSFAAYSSCREACSMGTGWRSVRICRKTRSLPRDRLPRVPSRPSVRRWR